MRCRVCRSELDRGVVCVHCYAVEDQPWPPQTKEGLIAEVEMYKREAKKVWQFCEFLESLRSALGNSELRAWFDQRFPPCGRKVSPPKDILDLDPGTEAPPIGESSPQPNLPGIEGPERLPPRKRR